MRSRAAWLSLVAGLALCGPALLAGAASAPQSELPLGTFEQSQPGKPPEGWKTRSDEDGAVYVVQQSGDQKYLHADAKGVAVPIGKEEEYDVRQYPILTWRWRILALPQGGDERKKETGDSAAGVYVVFGGWPVPKTVKYVWSASLPPGTRLESPFSGQTKVVVLRSGMDLAGQWVEERVNVLEDYRRFFGEDPEKARGIAILSDADNTKSRAVADYDAIVARRAGAAAGSTGGASRP
jgi:hypothetical protein